MPDQKRILELCVKMGSLLLINGAEIFRAQQTMELVARTFNANEFHVYVLTNGVFASLNDDSHTHNAQIRHLPNATVHMGRIVALNDLSRKIVAGECSLEDAFIKADEIAQFSYTKNYIKLLACAVGAACFAFLFGGSLYDALAAFGAGFMLQLFLIALSKYSLGKIVTNIVGAAIVALVSFLLYSAGLGNNLDKIIIGGIIPLVPGMALTTSIRDFANADYLSGTIRLMDTLLIGGSIAIGIAFMLKLIGFCTGVAT